MPPKKITHKRAASNATPVAAKRAKLSKDAQDTKIPTGRRGGRRVSYKEESADVTSADERASQSDYDEDTQDDEVEGDVEEDDDDDEADVSDSPKPKKRTPAKKAAAPKGLLAKAKDLLLPGADTGLDPGTQVIIKKPKARPAGKTPYKDETIHPNTMLFLGDLRKNNNRPWLKSNDPDFRASQADFASFMEQLSEKVIEVDETVPELPQKDIILRIYRDVRFSKDPTPYKTSFSGGWSRTGRKGPFAKYYFQIKPGHNIIAAGIWQPDAQQLQRIRAAIDRHPQRLKNVLKDVNIRKDFLSGVPAKDKAVVKAFCAHNKENALKSKPKGYDHDHKDIELLRLRNFTISHKLTDAEVTSPDILDRAANLIGMLVPFVTYLNSVVMPDDEEEDEQEEDSGGANGTEAESNEEDASD